MGGGRWRSGIAARYGCGTGGSARLDVEQRAPTMGSVKFVSLRSDEVAHLTARFWRGRCSVFVGITSTTMDRKPFAERLAAGLAGWFQQLAAQDLHLEVGEEAARVELVRMISAQRAFVPETSKRPLNWPAHDKRRIDVAVLGRRDGALGWYGAIELKWPGTKNDVAALRQDMVQDAIRVAFSQTGNMNARFFILGGSETAIHRVFDTPHPTAGAKEFQRGAFNALFSRDLAAPDGRLTNADLMRHFPSALDRIHPDVTTGWTRRFAVEVIAVAEARIGRVVRGHVYVWQCKK